VTRPRLLTLTLACAAVAALAAAAPASAHPLGNFSINHLTQVRVSSDRVDALYLLDQAEIPTFQERGLAPAEVLARKRAEIEHGLKLTINGRPVQLRLGGTGTIAFPPGQGGLKLTRVEVPLSARVQAPRAVALRDETFPGRVGWKAIVVRPGSGTAVRSSVSSEDPTGGLRTYPKSLLQSPLDERSAELRVRPGAGTVTAPRTPGGKLETTKDRGGDGFAGVFADAASGRGVLLLLLLIAFGWGALHALSPGHGKAMVAAYLIGTRGTARHAAGLGAIVTVTHTIGVFALGLVTLLLSQYILPEDLYPWLNLTAGLLVVGVGVQVLRSRVKHAHHHHHHHDAPSKRSILALGASAGLIPCPTALVVLLGAISQHQLALGLVLIVAFSAGLAATLTGLGIAVVKASQALARLRVPGRLAGVAPAVSAALIVVIGAVLTAQAVPQLGV
jgi:ABC-type nickel/cobalt efflux system permease component RcnA